MSRPTLSPMARTFGFLLLVLSFALPAEAARTLRIGMMGKWQSNPVFLHAQIHTTGSHPLRYSKLHSLKTPVSPAICRIKLLKADSRRGRRPGGPSTCPCNGRDRGTSDR